MYNTVSKLFKEEIPIQLHFLAAKQYECPMIQYTTRDL